MATKAPPVAFRLTRDQMIDLRAVARTEGLSPGQLAARLVTDYIHERTNNVLTFTPRPTPDTSRATHPSTDDRPSRLAAILAAMNPPDYPGANTPPQGDHDDAEAVCRSESPSDPPTPR
jgi:hypothetical protein